MSYNHRLRIAIVSKQSILTQANFAKKIGVQPAKVSRVINGEMSLIDDDEKKRWAKVLDVPVAQIFGAGLVAQGESRG